MTDSTDVKIKNGSNQDALGSENSIFIHPTDSKIILEAHNKYDGNGISAYVSQDGGLTWAGDTTAVGGTGGYIHPTA